MTGGWRVHSRGSPAGFTLVELLVAMALLGALMVGMARVFAGGLQACAGVHEALAAQRTLRCAMARITDDLYGMGYFFPPPGTRPIPVAASALPALQSGFMLVPDQPRWKEAGGSFVAPRPGEDPFEPDDKKADELSFVLDEVLPARGALAAAIPAAAPADPAWPGGRVRSQGAPGSSGRSRSAADT